MVRLFLSYAREDAARASKVAKAFLAEGYEVWWDQKIPAGLTWREFIPERIRSSSAVVVLWTGTSIQSEWVGEEASLARSQRKLLPVRLDKVEPPFGFREVEAANLIGWNGERDNDGWKNLMAGVRRLTSGRKPVDVGASRETASSPNGSRERHVSRKMVALGVGLAVMAAIAFVGLSDRRGAPAVRAESEVSAPTTRESEQLTGEVKATFDPAAYDPVDGAAAPERAQAGGAFDVRQLSEPIREAVLAAREAAEQGRAVAEEARQMQRRAHAASALARAGGARLEVVTLSNGDAWAGQVRRAGQSVFGVYTLRSGLTLSGRFQVDRSGSRLFGDPYVRQLSDGARFYGRTEDGAHWIGPGLFEFADGGSHAGVWVAASGETFGVRTFADGRRYEGQFHHVHRSNYDMDQHGLGVLWSAEGRVIQAGRWNENAFVGH